MARAIRYTKFSIDYDNFDGWNEMCPVCPQRGKCMPKSTASPQEPSQGCLVCAPVARKGGN